MVINVKNKIFILALLAAVFSACSDDVTSPQAPDGDGTKTPIGVTALLDAGGATRTRAAGMEFESGDKLLAYVRHVTWDGSTGARTLVSVQNSPKLVAFTKGSTDMVAYDGTDITPIGLTTALGLTSSNTQKTTDLTADPVLYWDDFSEGGKGDATDIRTDGHYLQSYYGYCYNGSPAHGQTGTHITSALTEATGNLGWQVATDQSAANTNDPDALKHSDLLWSAEQTPIAYAHVDGEGKKNHGTLVLPYTHAMSKVTINVTLHESFGDGAVFQNVNTTLHEMFTRCTCTAPTYTLSNKGTTTDITMWNQKSTDASTTTTCTFEAIVVPSILSVVNNFATITGLDGNTYVIPTTEAMLQKGSEHDNKGWGDQLTETEEHINNGTAQAPPKTRTTIERGKGYEMKSGVNYVLNVSISKQQITVSALIKDWEDVTAEGVGLVQFTSDVNGKGDIAEELKSDGFDVYKNSVNTVFDTKTTALTWNSTYSKWEYSPVIYWAGQGDASYFRALSPKNQGLTMNQGTDMLWGYACDDDANNGSKVGTPSEVKITPRTGDVPLCFEHPMSKISVQLKTSDGSPSDATSSAVDLTGARIEISNMATTGTLELVKGSITPGVKVATPIAGTNSISPIPVIPQRIDDDAILKITLRDGTVYKLRLNKCYVNDDDDNDTNNVLITEWERGKHYTYTINVEKEKITFRAMIKDWNETQGNGNATLEWD